MLQTVEFNFCVSLVYFGASFQQRDFLLSLSFMADGFPGILTNYPPSKYIAKKTTHIKSFSPHIVRKISYNAILMRTKVVKMLNV